MPGFDFGWSGDVTVPAFMMVIVGVVDGEDVVPTVAEESLDEPVATPEVQTMEVDIVPIEAGFKSHAIGGPFEHSAFVAPYLAPAFV